MPKGSPSGTTTTTYAINPYYRANGNCGAPAGLGTSRSDRHRGARGGWGILPLQLRGPGRRHSAIRPERALLAQGLLQDQRRDDRLRDRHAVAVRHEVGICVCRAAAWSLRRPRCRACTTRMCSRSSTPTTWRARTTARRSAFAASPRVPAPTTIKTDYQQYLVGVDGKAWGWDYHARVSSGIGVTTDTLAGGYMGFTCFNAAIATGQYDPILGTGSEIVTPMHSRQPESRGPSRR